MSWEVPSSFLFLEKTCEWSFFLKHWKNQSLCLLFFDPLPHTIHETNSRWMVDRNVKGETISYLEMAQYYISLISGGGCRASWVLDTFYFHLCRNYILCAMCKYSWVLHCSYMFFSECMSDLPVIMLFNLFLFDTSVFIFYFWSSTKSYTSCISELYHEKMQFSKYLFSTVISLSPHHVRIFSRVQTWLKWCFYSKNGKKLVFFKLFEACLKWTNLVFRSVL